MVTSPENWSMIEGGLSQGDRRLGEVIVKAEAGGGEAGGGESAGGGLGEEGGDFRLVEDSRDALNVRDRLLGKLLVVEAGQAASQYQRTPFIPTGNTPHRGVRAFPQALLGHLSDLVGSGTITTIHLRTHTTNQLCESVSREINVEAASTTTEVGNPGAWCPRR